MKHIFVFAFLIFSQILTAAPKSYSFLWVIDNSDSMEEQREKLIDVFPDFLNELNSNGPVEFRMAFTTTDYFKNKGGLVQDKNNRFLVESGKNAGRDFASILGSVVDSPTSFWEQGLEASHLAISKYGKKFLLKDSELIVIYVSDEDDYSCKENCFGVEPENNKDWKPFKFERYTEFFQGLRKQGYDPAIFPVVGSVDSLCDVPSYGKKYMSLKSKVSSKLGITGSICVDDVEESILDIAKVLAKKEPTSGPKWIVDPVDFETIEIDSTIVADLSSYVRGNGVSFSLVSGPKFMVFNQGLLLVSPRQGDIGKWKVTVRATDGTGKYADGTIQFEVTKKQGAPPVWMEDPIVSEAKVNQAFRLNLAGKVLGSGTLNFSLVAGPAWLSITSDGVAMGTPKQAGDSRFRVRVTDAYGRKAEATVIVEVKDGASGKLPKWKEGTFAIRMKVGTAASIDLKDYIENSADLDLKFSAAINALPSYLSMGENGLVSGAPKDTDIGTKTTGIVFRVVGKDWGEMAMISFVVEK